MEDGSDLFTHFAIAAAVQAVEDHGAPLDPLRTGVVLGTTMAGARALLEAQHLLDTKGPEAVPRKLNIQAWPNMAAGQVALRWKLHGPLLTVSTACTSSSLDAIGTAARLVQSSIADMVLAGGTESGCARRCTTARRRGMSQAVTDPRRASLPFDVCRSGIVEGEGAGVVVLERAERPGPGAPRSTGWCGATPRSPTATTLLARSVRRVGGPGHAPGPGRRRSGRRHRT